MTRKLDMLNAAKDLGDLRAPPGNRLEALKGNLHHHLGVPVQRVNELVRGKRGVTPETAWLLADAFGTTPEFWLNLQTNHDLVRARPARKVGPLARTAVAHP